MTTWKPPLSDRAGNESKLAVIPDYTHTRDDAKDSGALFIRSCDDLHFSTMACRRRTVTAIPGCRASTRIYLKPGKGGVMQLIA